MSTLTRAASIALGGMLLVVAGAHAAEPPHAEFRSAGDNAVILYDAPSVRAGKLFVVSRGYPLEVVVTVQGWVKVRDAAGTLSWAESKSLGTRRTVMVKTPGASVVESPEEKSPVVFRAQQNVILDFVDAEPAGWLRVKHPDGATGFVRTTQVWGS